MTDKEPRDLEIAGLLRRAREDRRAEAAEFEFDEMDIAAYLDGRMEGPTRERLEAWLAASPDAFELVRASRETLAGALPPVPASVIERASAVVRPVGVQPASVEPEPRSGWLSALFGSVWAEGRFAAVGFAASAVVIAGIAGFELGRAGVAYSDSVDQLVAQELDLGVEQDDIL